MLQGRQRDEALPLTQTWLLTVACFPCHVAVVLAYAVAGLLPSALTWHGPLLLMMLLAMSGSVALW